MTYPREFVEKVCAEYESTEIRLAAESGKYGLGVLLSRGAEMMMSPEDTVEFIDAGDCKRVRDDAQKAVRRRGLHAEWMRIICRSLSIASDGTSISPPSKRALRPHWSPVSP